MTPFFMVIKHNSLKLVLSFLWRTFEIFVLIQLRLLKILCLSIINDAFVFQIFKFRFSQDLRVDEVKYLLQSSKPVMINLVQKPEVR